MGWEGRSDTHFLVAIVVCVDAISAGHPMLARLERGEGTGGLMVESGNVRYKILENPRHASVGHFMLASLGRKGDVYIGRGEKCKIN